MLLAIWYFLFVCFACSLPERSTDPAPSDNEENLIGYVAYTIDYYSSSCYNFGLMSFLDEPSPYITSAIREIISNIKKQNLHRIEFRAIEGNPITKSYDKFVEYFGKNGYKATKHILTDCFKDRYGRYRDDYIYEFVKDCTYFAFGEF